MKILLITHIFSPAVDGGSKVISKIGEYFQKNGHQIMVLTSDCSSTDDFINPKSISPFNQREMSEGQRDLIRLPVRKTLRRPLKLICFFLPKNFYFRQFLEIFQKGPIFKFIPLLKSLIQIKKFSPDLIICGPLPITIVLYANLIKKICKSKILINASFHQTDSDFYKKPLIKTLRSADFIWSLSQYEKEFFVKKLKINENKILNIGNGIDNDFIIEKNKIKFPKNPNILFIGSFASHKKIDLLIKSFSNLLRSEKLKSEISLTIAGQKTLFYPKIEKQLKQLPKNIRKNIKIIFNFSDQKLKKIIDKSTVLILPSTQESFGLVLIESMARGKSVIASDIPPIKELIRKTQGGLVFKINSQKNLTETISKIVTNKNLAKKLGLNGLDYVSKHFTWDKIGNQIWQKISS